MSEAAVETAGLSYSYGRHGAPRALDGITIAVPRGVMASIVGPDGAGKTTLVKLMTGILEPDEGSARVMGDDTVRGFERVKRRIGYLSQSFTLYGDLSVDENIEFFAEIHRVPDFRKRREELLEFTRLTPFRKRPAERLSGGMKRKLALAATLVHSPAVLFLDEPTTGVDPVSRREFWIILADLLKRGMTIVMTTPYMDEAERSGLVGFLHGGRLLFADAPAAVRALFTRAVFEVVPDDVRRAAEVLKGAGNGYATESGGFSVETFGDRLNVAVREGCVTHAELAALLAGAGVGLLSLRRVAPNLENVFIAFIKKEESGAE